MAAAPSADERALLARLAPGSSDTEAVVAGAVVRSLLLGGHLPPDAVFQALRVTGRLDLSGLRLPERALRFEACVFEGGLTADGAELASLRLVRCTLPSASLLDARIGVVGFDGLDAAGHVALDGVSADRISVRRSKVRGVLSFAAASVTRDMVVHDSTIGTGKASLVGDHAEIGRRLTFEDGFHAEGPVSLVAARIDTLRAEPGADLGDLLLSRAQLGDLNIEPGARVRGGLSAANLTVTGRATLAGGWATDAGRLAIDLSGAQFAGDLVLGKGFDSRGPIRLAGCQVGGTVTLQGTLAVQSGNGLDISRLSCGRLDLGFTDFAGGISVRQSDCTGLVLHGAYRCPPEAPLHLGPACSGRVSLGAAGGETRIAGALSLIGLSCHELGVAHLTIDAHAEGRWAGVAIAARHLAVETLTRLGDGQEGVTLNGAVALDHARLGDDLRIAGVRITAPATSAVAGEGVALSLRKASLGGALDFGRAGAPGLHATGSIDLSGAAVRGDVILGGLGLTAAAGGSRLDLAATAVEGALIVPGLATEGAWTIDLSEASVARLDDAHGKAWTASGAPAMRVAGFRYQGLEGLTQARSRKADDAVAGRLAWIETHARAAHARGEGFSPQPYRTLVSVLAAAGHDDGVKRTELAARGQQRRLGSASILYRTGGALLEITSGYGYAPTRAAIALVLYFLLGWAGVSLADYQGAFEASPFMDGSILANAIPGHCPWLRPPLYALDLMVPLTTLGNENFCSVRVEAAVWNWAAVAYRLFGWVILSIALLTFSGIMKREV